MQSSPHFEVVSRNGRNPARELQRFLRDYRPHKYPRVTVVLLLWIFGLFSVFYLPAPVPITPESLARYEAKITEAEAIISQRRSADQRLAEAQMEVYEAKEWFWQFKPEVRAVVRQRQAVEAEAQAEVNKFERQKQKLLTEARGELGLWSAAGVEESRQLFWNSFKAGKVFGQRQTFWDTMLNAIGGRDRNWLSMLIELILTTVVNFTAGMLVSIFVYAFQLPWLLMSYQASFFSGVAFFLVALTGAISVIAGFLLLLYGASATAVYSVVTLAGASARRLEDQHRRANARLRDHLD